MRTSIPRCYVGMRGAGFHRRGAIGYRLGMAKKKRFLTATLPDGYVKTIGPTTASFTHYWRIVAHLGGGRTEVFWGHAKSLREATGKKIASADAAKLRGWERYEFEIVALVEKNGEER